MSKWAIAGGLAVVAVVVAGVIVWHRRDNAARRAEVLSKASPTGVAPVASNSSRDIQRGIGADLARASINADPVPPLAQFPEATGGIVLDFRPRAPTILSGI